MRDFHWAEKAVYFKINYPQIRFNSYGNKLTEELSF
jgi:hypothetical protein